ncbi:hypothetical protein EVAR_90407_1 [Eumeta japonica]|uniref:Uncharacterized protein n=1 Tax=Eumeta variegata TaxID=151549 RepID=A0A4C1Y7T2_EUMVA|nr:hypothetical protein EVAR_90407_1 [Eumeta japonica]
MQTRQRRVSIIRDVDVIFRQISPVWNLPSVILLLSLSRMSRARFSGSVFGRRGVIPMLSRAKCSLISFSIESSCSTSRDCTKFTRARHPRREHGPCSTQPSSVNEAAGC